MKSKEVSNLEIIKHIENESIEIFDDGNKLIEMKFVADEFVIVIHSCKPIIISRENCDLFYYMLLELMRNEYEFGNVYSKKTEESLVWFSDQYCDLEDENAVDRVPRLIIKRIDGNFALYATNPYCINNNFTKNNHVIVFSPSNNGYYSKNLKTNRSLQDDFVGAYHNLCSEVPAVRK